MGDSGAAPESLWTLLRVSFGGITSDLEPKEQTLEPEGGTSLQEQQY